MRSQRCLEPAGPPPSSISLGLDHFALWPISCSLPPLFVTAVPAVWAQGPAFPGTSPVAPLHPRGGGQAFCWAFERGVCVRVQRVSLALARAGELECSAHA